MGSVNDPADPDYVAKICYTAAFVYACFIGFCGCQVGVYEAERAWDRRLRLPDEALLGATTTRIVRAGCDLSWPTCIGCFNVLTLFPQLTVHSRYPRGVQL